MKKEDKVIFSTSLGGTYFFIDNEKQFLERSRHTVIFKAKGKEPNCDIEGCENRPLGFFNFQEVDSKILGVPLNVYLKMSQWLLTRKMRFNKKTCQIELTT